KGLVGRHAGIDAVSEARNGREAVAIIRQRAPDLVLLDVQMPRMDGFAVVDAIGPERMPAVIFVTAHDEYAIRAFELAALNYVRLHVGEATHLLHVPMNTLEGVLDPERFLRIHRSHIVNVQRISQLWSLAHGQYVIELRSGLRLQSGRTYGDRIRGALSNPF